jgi:hypothetical protein
MQVLSPRRSRRVRNAQRPQKTQLCLERLETRALLSVYPLSPLEARHAYGFDALPLSGNDGKGQTIAIVDAYDDPTIFSDLNTFDQAYSLTSGGPSLYAQYGASSAVLTKATPQGKTRGNSGWAQEISLDVEWAHAIAPGAHILLVEARSNGLNDLLNAVDYATNHGASVVSMSWGSGEFSGETSYDSHFAHSGVTYVASAGDSGSVAEWPAVSPSVVAVGGTTLKLDSSGNYLGEGGWSGSGGGISAYESKPAYQSNVPQSSTQRTSPDVGYDGDPNTGFAVYDSYAGGGGWGQYGGTSAGAPQWSALVAITNEGRSSPLSSSGTLNGLYSLLNSSNTINTTYLNDVTTGSSGTYSAAPGYDLVTGVGSPVAGRLIVYLRGVSANVVLSAAASSSTTSTPASSTVLKLHGPTISVAAPGGIVAAVTMPASNSAQTAPVLAPPLIVTGNPVPVSRVPELAPGLLQASSSRATEARLFESAPSTASEARLETGSGSSMEEPDTEPAAPNFPDEEFIAGNDSWPQAVAAVFAGEDLVSAEAPVAPTPGAMQGGLDRGFSFYQATALAGFFFAIPGKEESEKRDKAATRLIANLGIRSAC